MAEPDAFGFRLLKSPRLWRAAVSELLSVLLFTFMGCGSVVSGNYISGANGGDPFAHLLSLALVHGLAVAALITASAATSGGHLNPSVTVAFVVTGRMKPIAGAVYIVFQIVGATIGAALIYGTTPKSFHGDLGSFGIQEVSKFQAFLLELITTYILVHVVLNTTDKRGAEKAAPLYVGFTVFAGIVTSGGFTGGAMNPALSLGPALVANRWRDQWIYCFGPNIGAVLASLVYKYLYFRPVENELLPEETEVLRKFGYEMPDNELAMGLLTNDLEDER